MKHFNMENRLETVYVLFNFGVADIMVQEFFARRMVSKTGTSARSEILTFLYRRLIMQLTCSKWNFMEIDKEAFVISDCRTEEL